MKFNTLIASAGLLSAFALARHEEHLSPREIQRRAELAKRCEQHIHKFNKKRHTKRMAKRQIDWSTATIPEAQPYYQVIQNITCVQVPEVIQGPYVRPQSELLRTDMSEGEIGVPLILDIGVLDMATYLLASLKMTEDEIEFGVTDINTDNETFLRRLYPTDSEGIMEMKTIFPGFYTGRTIHIHSQVYTDYTLFPNGTISSGNLVSTDQLYFEESLSAKIMALELYASHTQTPRITNGIDSFISDSYENRYDPVFDVIPADGVDPKNGMIAYITMGIDTANIQDAPMNIKSPGE